MTAPTTGRGPSSLASGAQRWLLPLHRWVGMTAGLVLAWIALTGTGLIFRDQLTPVVEPKLQQAPICTRPLPVDTLFGIARQVYPAVALGHYWLRPYSPRSAQLRFADNETVFIDPCSGALSIPRLAYTGIGSYLRRRTSRQSRRKAAP